MATVCFARHGESEANLLREFSNTGTKHPLTDQGRAQSLALADDLRRHDVRRIVATPILRARQTASIVGEQLGIAYEVSAAHTEYDVGAHEGRRDDDAWQEYFEVLDAWLRKGDHRARVAGGESFTDMARRFVPFVESLRNEPGTVVLIGHGGTYKCMLPYILDNVDNEFALANDLVNSAYVLAAPIDDGWTCVEWAGAPMGSGTGPKS